MITRVRDGLLLRVGRAACRVGGMIRRQGKRIRDLGQRVDTWGADRAYGAYRSRGDRAAAISFARRRFTEKLAERRKGAET